MSVKMKFGSYPVHNQKRRSVIDGDPLFAHKVAAALDRLAVTHTAPNSFVLDEIVGELHVPSPRLTRMELGRLLRSPSGRRDIAAHLRSCELGGYARQALPPYLMAVSVFPVSV